VATFSLSAATAGNARTTIINAPQVVPVFKLVPPRDAYYFIETSYHGQILMLGQAGAALGRCGCLCKFRLARPRAAGKDIACRSVSHGFVRGPSRYAQPIAFCRQEIEIICLDANEARRRSRHQGGASDDSAQ
jgi:hypothetical protein